MFPLYAAIRSGDSKLVKQLLSLGAKPRGNQLDAAVWHNEPSMVKLLLEAGADPNGEPNNPPLTSAAFRGSPLTTKLLLAQPNIDINKRDIDGQTALLIAVSRGHDVIVALLLEAGADSSIPNKHGETPAQKARQRIQKMEAVIKKLGGLPIQQRRDS
ncbi:MAG: ankyrin repeat domain-containing protein [Verrucomicrobiota bacterium]